ncbi:hypothetical protein VAPA_2c07480 [Variovorax paradoxus B4]|uniref:Uncharacterized protein n=1 Tax=Variovorax paradoxus B4 TaxID=1246301 RepID=T1XMF6_VARPD|nr:Imm6 family immunity protein [Variovorax paradoxus]AGU53305.1 hypothetical protein VAPA_2c07480 [Variovorax paradoxus B4]
MKVDINKFSEISIQAKIAFMEWLGRKAILHLKGASREAALAGLGLIEKWRRDQVVSGEELSLALMNEKDEGIYAYADSQNIVENDAVEVVGGVVSYVAWRVYKYTNKPMPQEYEQAGDDFLQWVLDQFEKLNSLDQIRISNVLNYLYDHYKSPADTLGEVVEISEMDRVANSQN